MLSDTQTKRLSQLKFDIFLDHLADIADARKQVRLITLIHIDAHTELIVEDMVPFGSRYIEAQRFQLTGKKDLDIAIVEVISIFNNKGCKVIQVRRKDFFAALVFDRDV